MFFFCCKRRTRRKRTKGSTWETRKSWSARGDWYILCTCTKKKETIECVCLFCEQKCIPLKCKSLKREYFLHAHIYRSPHFLITTTNTRKTGVKITFLRLIMCRYITTRPSRNGQVFTLGWEVIWQMVCGIQSCGQVFTEDLNEEWRVFSEAYSSF